METFTILAMLLILLIFAGLLIFSITVTRRAKEARTQIMQALDMTPVPEPDSALLGQIASLYRVPWVTSKDELLNVSRRLIPDGELFLFDLLDTSGDSNSIIESQAIAIRSNTLRLPPFQVFPKVDMGKSAFGGLANAIVQFAVSKVGAPVKFPEFPAFEARYTVTSTDPESARRFFDEDKIRYFSCTEYYALRAGGNLFIFTEIMPRFKLNDPSQMTRRINRALEVYQLLQQA